MPPPAYHPATLGSSRSRRCRIASNNALLEGVRSQHHLAIVNGLDRGFGILEVARIFDIEAQGMRHHFADRTDRVRPLPTKAA